MFTKPFIKTVCCLLWCAYAIHGTSQTTKGKDFWLGFMHNYRDNAPLEIYVASERITTGTITIPGTGFLKVFNIPANSTSSVNIPNSVMASEHSDVIEAKSVHISTCDTVSVYAINRGEASNGATVIYPTPSLGNDYMILTKKGDPDMLNEFLIVATQDNSVIEITPSVWTSSMHPPGISYTISLNLGQMCQITAKGADLTGTIVKSVNNNTGCFNFALFSGDECANIGNCKACDHLYSQLMPTNTWGKEFIIGKFAQKGHLIFRVLSKTNGTSFTIQESGSTTTHTLNAGKFYEYSNNIIVDPVYIKASEPVMVMQYMAGMYCDANYIGDPEQLIIYPIEQTINVATFYTIPSPLITLFYMNIMAKTSAITNVKLNGVNIAGSFTTVPANPLYSYAKGIPLTQNTHYQLVADTGFYAFVYAMGESPTGVGFAESYAYPVGASLKDLTFAIIEPSSLCPGEIWSFQAVNDPKASSYSWDFGDGNSGTGMSTSHVYQTEGTYSVTLTKAIPGACPIEIVKWVTVKRPSIKIRSILGASSLCTQPATLWTRVKNDTILLKVPTLCGDTIRQTFVNHLDSVRWSTGSRDSSITVNPSVTTKYYLYGYARGSSCLAVDSVVVNVASSYTTTIATGSASCLALGSATASTLGGVAPLSYTWTGSVSSGSVAVDLSAGHHTLTIADAGGCLQTHSFTISGSGSVTLAISGNTNICSGGSASLTASGALTYTWSGGVSSVSLAIVSPTINTTYTVIGADAAGCSGSQTVVVTVGGSIPIAISGNTSICSGGSASLTASGALTYSWSGDISTSSLAIVSPTTNTTYTVIGADAAGCSGSQTVMVIVNAIPTLTISGNLAGCSGNSTTLTVSGALAYSWVGIVSSSSLAVVSPTTNTTYTVIGSDAAGCSGSQTVVVTVGGSIPIAISGNTSICSGNTASLTASGALTYSWSGGVSTSSLAIVSPTTNTTYTVIGADAAGCSGSQTVTVTVDAIPTLSISGNTDICEGTSTTLTVSGAVSYTWSTGNSTASLTVNPLVTTTYSVIGVDAAVCSGSQTITVTVNPIPLISTTGNTLTCLSPTVTLTAVSSGSYSWSGPGIVAGGNTANPLVDAPGSYTLLVVHRNGCGNKAFATVVDERVMARAEFVTDPEKGAAPLTVLFTNKSNGTSVFFWNFGDGTNSTAINPQHTFLEEGNYTIYLIAGSGLCSGTATMNLIVEQGFTFYAPNCISPNQDGINDVFLPKGIGWDVSTFLLDIFDRWGNLIFSTKNAFEGWDGSYLGNRQLVQDGTYTWKVSVKDLAHQQHKYIGHVIILK